jgi:hypothetical protein
VRMSKHNMDNARTGALPMCVAVWHCKGTAGFQWASQGLFGDNDLAPGVRTNCEHAFL